MTLQEDVFSIFLFDYLCLKKIFSLKDVFCLRRPHPLAFCGYVLLYFFKKVLFNPSEVLTALKQTSHGRSVANGVDEYVVTSTILFDGFVYIHHLYSIHWIVLRSISFGCAVFVLGSFCPSLWGQTLLMFLCHDFQSQSQIVFVTVVNDDK